jgi:hypothetical protein
MNKHSVHLLEEVMNVRQVFSMLLFADIHSDHYCCNYLTYREVIVQHDCKLPNYKHDESINT